MAIVWALTLSVVTVNVAVVAFAGTVTLARTVAEAELLPNVTTAPPFGAGPFRVTVAVGFVEPPCTVFVFNPSDVTPDAGGITVRVAL